MIEVMTEKIAGFKKDLAGQKELLIKSEEQINEWSGYLKNMRNSDYIEDENAENYCATCLWMDDHSKPFAGPFCIEWEMIVDSDTGSCCEFCKV